MKDLRKKVWWEIIIMCFDINDIESAFAGLINLIKVKWPQSCCDCCDNWLSDSHVEHLITFSHKEKKMWWFFNCFVQVVCVVWVLQQQAGKCSTGHVCSPELNVFISAVWMHQLSDKASRIQCQSDNVWPSLLIAALSTWRLLIFCNCLRLFKWRRLVWSYLKKASCPQWY